jgi:hypothetical protein
MQKRIKRFNNSGRRLFTTVIESDQSTNSKKRKREKNSITAIFTILTENITVRYELDDINRSN